MVAAVQSTLEHVLAGVVDAWLQDLAAARGELACARAAASSALADLEAERAKLERRLAERDGQLETARREGQAAAENVLELRRRIEGLEGELTKTAKMGSGSPTREAVSNPGREMKPASGNETTSEKRSSTPATSLPARDFAARPSEDLSKERVGSYVCEGRTGIARADGRAIWRFRCEHCKAPKDYTVNDVRRIRKHHPDTTCPCQRAGAGPQRGRIVDRTGLELGLFTCDGGNGAEGGDRRWIFHCRECKGRLALTSNQVSAHVSGGTTPRCTSCEPERRGRKPAAPAHEATEEREDRPLDLDFSELDALAGGPTDDLDDLLTQSMRASEGDGRLRAMAFGDREREDEDDEEADEDDDQEEAAE
jgi:hypothetical protein